MLLTRKSTNVSAAQSRLARSVSGMLGRTIDRRAFLQRSGVALGAGAVATQLPFSIVEKSEAAQDAAGGKLEVKRTICTHCSVGCSIDAVVQNGLWIRQEPVFDSRIEAPLAQCAPRAPRSASMESIMTRIA